MSVIILDRKNVGRLAVDDFEEQLLFPVEKSRNNIYKGKMTLGVLRQENKCMAWMFSTPYLWIASPANFERVVLSKDSCMYIHCPITLTAKTKVFTIVKHNRHKQHNEPIRKCNQSHYAKNSASQSQFYFYFWLVDKVVGGFFLTSHNINKIKANSTFFWN